MTTLNTAKTLASMVKAEAEALAAMKTGGATVTLKVATLTFKTLKEAKETAVALAAATGKPTTMVRLGNEWHVHSHTVRQANTRHLEGNTAADRNAAPTTVIAGRLVEYDGDYQVKGWGADVADATTEAIDPEDRVARVFHKTERVTRKVFVQDGADALKMARQRRGTRRSAEGGGYWVSFTERDQVTEGEA